MLKRVAFLVVGCVLVSVISGYLTAWWVVNRASAKIPEKVSARELVLSDEHGHIGARLAWKDGQPQIQLFDRNNRMRSALFLEPNGVPDLYLYDDKNAVRAALNLFDSGIPNLAFLDGSQHHMVLTEYDQQSYNTVFSEIGKDVNRKIAMRRMTADENGLHVLDSGKPATAK